MTERRWQIDTDSGFVFTPSGARAFRLDGERMAVLVFDKRTRSEVAIPVVYLLVMLLLKRLGHDIEI